MAATLRDAANANGIDAGKPAAITDQKPAQNRDQEKALQEADRQESRQFALCCRAGLTDA